MQELVSKLLDKNKNYRPSASELLKIDKVKACVLKIVKKIAEGVDPESGF
jgi:hypothetical protein